MASAAAWFRNEMHHYLNKQQTDQLPEPRDKLLSNICYSLNPKPACRQAGLNQIPKAFGTKILIRFYPGFILLQQVDQFIHRHFTVYISFYDFFSLV